MMTNINQPAYTPHLGSQDKGETKREKWAAQFMAASIQWLSDEPKEEDMANCARNAVKAAEALEKALNAQEGEGK